MGGESTESLLMRVMCKYAVSKGHAHLKKLDAEITSEVILEVNPIQIKLLCHDLNWANTLIY